MFALIRPLVLALVSAALLSSCQVYRMGERLTVASAGRITSLDPAQANSVSTIQLLSALGDPLYSLTRSGALEPRLASGPPSVSADRLTVAIPLRSDVLFHDGSRFDADAMAFSLRRLLEIGRLDHLVGGRIKAIEASAPDQITLTLSRPSTSLNGLLTAINLTPVSPIAYRDHATRLLHDSFIGTGPYKLVRFRDDQQRLEPFEGYWGDAPQNQGLDLITLRNSTALFGALRSGEVDVLISGSIDEDQRRTLHEMARENRLREGVGPAMEIGYITLLSNAPPLHNPQLRQAIALSLNRNEVSERVSYGLRTPLRALIPPSLRMTPTDSWPFHAPDKARNLFREAGYCDGRTLNLPLTFRSNVPADKLLALTWQAQIKRDLSDCLVLDLDGVETTTVYEQLAQGAFKAVMLDWRGSYPDPEAYLTPLLSCTDADGAICRAGEAALSGSFWSAPDLQTTLLTIDRQEGAERDRTLQTLETIAAEGAAYIPVWLDSPRAWSQRSVSEPEFDGSGHLRLDRLRRHQP